MHSHITAIEIDESLLVRSRQHKVERERVITDLLKESQFILKEMPPPYRIRVQIVRHKFLMEVEGRDDAGLSVSLPPLKRLIKDYHIVCESYETAIRHADPRKVEAIDMGRRGLHDEGAALLEGQLAPYVTMDKETSRKVFSLVYFLYSP